MDRIKKAPHPPAQAGRTLLLRVFLSRLLPKPTAQQVNANMALPSARIFLDSAGPANDGASTVVPVVICMPDNSNTGVRSQEIVMKGKKKQIRTIAKNELEIFLEVGIDLILP